MTHDWIIIETGKLMRGQGKAVLDTVAARYGLRVGDLKSSRRTRNLAWPRQEVMQILHDRCGWSLKQIGRLLGNRDHTTILYGVRQARIRLERTGRAA